MEAAGHRLRRPQGNVKMEEWPAHMAERVPYCARPHMKSRAEAGEKGRKQSAPHHKTKVSPQQQHWSSVEVAHRPAARKQEGAAHGKMPQTVRGAENVLYLRNGSWPPLQLKVKNHADHRRQYPDAKGPGSRRGANQKVRHDTTNLCSSTRGAQHAGTILGGRSHPPNDESEVACSTRCR